MFTHILFDLDGTLTDSAPGITRSVQYALKHFGIEVEDPTRLNAFVGPPLKTGFMELYGFSAEQAEIAAEKYRERYSVKGIWENSPYDGIPELLKILLAHEKTLILATSKPEHFAIEILRHFGLLDFFSLVRGSSTDGTLSEKADIIASVLLDSKIDPQTAIMVGDRKYDILGAQANNIASIGVLYGYGSREELAEAGATYIADNLHELNTILLYNSDKVVSGNLDF